jgi:hypothetical protein
MNIQPFDTSPSWLVIKPEKLIKQIVSGPLRIEQTTLELDKLGVDFILHTSSDSYNIEVKNQKSHGHLRRIHLEYSSVVETNAIGWALDPKKVTDWLLVIWHDETRRWVMIDYSKLRSAFQANFETWCKYKHRPQKSYDEVTDGMWHSLAAPVPLDVIYAALGQRGIAWDEGTY